MAKCFHCDFMCIHLFNALSVKGIVHVWWLRSRNCISKTFNRRKLQLLHFEIHFHVCARVAPFPWPRSISRRFRTPLTVHISLWTPSWLCWPLLDLMAIYNTPIKSQFHVCITSYGLPAFAFTSPILASQRHFLC